MLQTCVHAGRISSRMHSRTEGRRPETMRGAGEEVAACLGSPYASDRRVYPRDEAREWRPPMISTTPSRLPPPPPLFLSVAFILFPSLHLVLEFRNAASSLTGLRARLPLENRDATFFLFAIFLLEQFCLSLFSSLLLCKKEKKKKKVCVKKFASA